MDWLLQHWQTIAALAVVTVTVVLFARRLLRPKQSGGCGGGCACQMKPKPRPEVRSHPRP